MRFLLAFIVLLLSLQAAGQRNDLFTLKGRVVEENGTPIPYATIALSGLMAPDIIVKGVVSDREGYFELVMIKDKYIFNVRSLGYKNFSKLLTPEMDPLIDFGDIVLKVQSKQLEMVTVKPLVEMKADEITYNLMADPDRETSTLHEILDKVPLIERSPMGNLYVDTPDKKFLVVRNGKKDVLFEGNINDVLKAIPAKGFATVTILLAPPEYYGKYDYVVNIKTDKNASLYGAVGLTEVDGDVSGGSIAPKANVTVSLDKVRVGLYGEFENRNEPKSTTSVRQKSLVDGSGYVLEQINQSSGEKWGTGIRLSSDLGEKHFANWRFGYGRDFSRSKDITTSVYDGDGQPDISDIVTRSQKKLWGGGVEYQYDIAKNRQVLNVGYQFNGFPFRRQGYVTGILHDMTDEKQQEQTIQFHYYGALTNGLRIEAGTGYIYRYYLQDISEESSYNYQEVKKHIVNLYGRLGISKKTISASVGLKIDYLNDGDGALLDTDGRSEYISSTGIHFMPEARISLLFPKSLFSRFDVQYKMTHYRPSLKMLSVYEDHSNPNFIIKGNPELKDITNHFLSFSTNIKSWRLMFNWLYEGNDIQSYWLKDEQERIIQTYANQGYSSSYHLGVFRGFNVKQWGFSCNARVNYAHATMPQDEIDRDFSVQLSTNSSYTFRQGWKLGMGVMYYEMFSRGYSSYRMFPVFLTLDLRKNLFKNRGELAIRCGNLLRFRTNVEQKVNAEAFYMTHEIKRNSIPLSLTFKLRIGSYKIRPTKQIRRGVIIDDIAPE